MKKQIWGKQVIVLLIMLLALMGGAFAAQDKQNITSSDANTGLTFRAAVNSNLQSLVTNSSGATAPATTYAYQFWADTTNGLLKQRNAANNAWISLWDLGTGYVLNATNATTATTAASATTATTATNATGINGASVPTSSSYIGTNSSGQIISAAAPSAAAIQGTFKALSASATGTNATVTVAADAIILENVSNAAIVVRSVSLSINTASSGANGLDTGSLAGSTWYSVWVINNGSTTAGLISASATAPTMPSGYTYKARIGWVRTDGTANKYPLSFIQYGRSVRYKVASGSNVTVLPVMGSGSAGSISTPTWVAIATGSFLPSTAYAIAFSSYSPSAVVMVAPNNLFGADSSGTNPPPYDNHAFQQNMPGHFLLESTNIYWASNNSGNVLFCLGWEDNL